jgi:hypothetical protein
MTKPQLLKIAVIILLNIVFYQTANAQNISQTKTDSALTTRAQNVFVELGGPGLLFSGNYDTRFSQRKDGLGGRIGIGFIATGGISLVSVPVQLNYLLGNNSKYFEIGLGATYASFNSASNFLAFSPSTSDKILGTMTFGYRYQPVDGGFSFRANIDPLFDSSNFIPYYFGVSFGYTFK